MANEREIKEKEMLKVYHDRKSVVREFSMGDYFLVFRPIRKGKFENQQQGPFIITNKITEVTYQVYLGMSGKRYRTFHVNYMKQWTSPATAVFLVRDPEEEPPESSREKLTHSMPTSHHMDLKKLKDEYKDVLKDVPGKTTLVQHDIPTADAVPIRLNHYRLVTPDWNLPFILQTNASATGLGYVLSQVNGKGEENPIAYASKKMLASEKNYSAIEREALAIVKGIKHFWTYLDGSTFTIQMDHNPIPIWEILKIVKGG